MLEKIISASLRQRRLNGGAYHQRPGQEALC